MIKVNEIQYKEFGRCIEVSNGIVKAVMSCDFGPRVLCFSYTDGKNHLFEDHEHRAMASASTPEMDEYFGKGETFRVYGGARVWASPQSMPETFYPDNNEVKITVTNSGVIATGPVEKKNAFVKELEIRMAENEAKCEVISRITNKADTPKECAVWSVLAVAPGGTQIIPLPKTPTKGTSNKHLALWPFTKMNDKRVKWLEGYIAISQDSSYIDYDEFKVGVNNEAGYAVHVLGDECLVLTFNVNADLKYYDDKIWYEGYTNNISSEMEVLGEYGELLSECTKEVSATWELKKGVTPPPLTDEGIDKFIKSIGF